MKCAGYLQLCVLIAILSTGLSEDCEVGEGEVLVSECNTTLHTGQFLCTKLDIDPDTQQLANCSREGKGLQECEAAPGIICKQTCNSTFYRQIDCKWTNGYNFDTALLLSIFLGMFGADRFYLGYPAIGFLKFATLGFFFLGNLIDVILIATQTLGPADNSSYVMSYFGPVLHIVTIGENTYRKEQPDWYSSDDWTHS
eukprot:TRINITY_DN11618_c0_g1_i1.p2 TRINITY_DN11618_c0_g1~~TRINITY_DN11618_c0_g1_i1.p2  ORF type:complete len:198 (+),score=39.31 TRINITY_DN11618_c0_g1_i1:55-648(+)